MELSSIGQVRLRFERGGGGSEAGRLSPYPPPLTLTIADGRQCSLGDL